MQQIDLTGTWRMVSVESLGPGGATGHPFGPEPVGYVTYTSEGFVSVVMTSGGRSGYASAAERAAAAETTFAYSGRYEVDGSQVRHHVEVSLNPNMCGHTLTREIELVGNRLNLEARGPDAASTRMTWDRC